MTIPAKRRPVVRRRPVCSRHPKSHAASILHAEAGHWVAKFPRGLSDRADLVQEGQITLLRAQQLFDPTRSFAAFDTYLTTALRNRYKNLLARAWGWQHGDDEHLRCEYVRHRVGAPRRPLTFSDSAGYNMKEPAYVGEPDQSGAVDVRLVLEGCSPEEREVVSVLHEHDGCVARAAKQAGVKVTLVNRYRNLLRKRMAWDV